MKTATSLSGQWVCTVESFDLISFGRLPVLWVGLPDFFNHSNNFFHGRSHIWHLCHAGHCNFATFEPFLLQCFGTSSVQRQIPLQSTPPWPRTGPTEEDQPYHHAPATGVELFQSASQGGRHQSCTHLIYESACGFQSLLERDSLHSEQWQEHSWEESGQHRRCTHRGLGWEGHLWTWYFHEWILDHPQNEYEQFPLQCQGKSLSSSPSLMKVFHFPGFLPSDTIKIERGAPDSASTDRLNSL